MPDATYENAGERKRILTFRHSKQPLQTHQAATSTKRRQTENRRDGQCPSHQFSVPDVYAYRIHFATSAKLGFLPYISMPTR